MRISTRTLKHCALVTVSGRIDSTTAPELDQALQGLIRSGVHNLAINLREVPFISSAGLRSLIAAYIALRRQHPPGAVAFSECSPDLKATFELVGFHHQFGFYDEDAEAVGAF